MPKDVLVSIDNVTVNTSTELRAILDNKTAGDIVQVAVARGDRWQYQSTLQLVNLTVSENRTVMGIMGGGLLTKENLENYQTFAVDRFSTLHGASDLSFWGNTVFGLVSSILFKFNSLLANTWQTLSSGSGL